MTNWERNAARCQDEYGSYVNFEERFYICPFCGEPIYKEDWNEHDLNSFICPVCEDSDNIGEMIVEKV